MLIGTKLAGTALVFIKKFAALHYSTIMPYISKPR